MKIAIIDDEIIYQERIKKCLEVIEGIEIFCFSNPEVIEDVYDLILLDIDLGEINGIDYNKSTISRTIPVIFVTNHEHYYKDAYFYNVLGFILKDNLEKELPKKVQEVIDIFNSKIKVKVSYGIEEFFEKDILYFYVEDTILYVMAKKSNNPIEITERSLQGLQDRLSDSFVRVNRNTLININFVNKIMVTTNSCIMSNNKIIEISRRNWKSFLREYNKMRTR